MSLCLSTELCLLWMMSAPWVALPPPPLSQTSLYSSVKWAEAGPYTVAPLPAAFQPYPNSPRCRDSPLTSCGNPGLEGPRAGQEEAPEALPFP